MELIDKFFLAINPAWAVSRKQNQLHYEMLSKHEKTSGKRAYEAAAHGPRTEGWFAPDASSTQTVGQALSTLRARSRSLVENNPWASKAVDVLVNNVVGKGIRPMVKNKRLQQRWNAWAESTACDYDGFHTFYGLQQLVMRTVAATGEAICIINYVNGQPAIQVLEGDYLDMSKSSFNINGQGGYTVNGVEFDGSGRKIAYWIHTTNPFIYKGTSVRVPAERVIHIFHKLRPGQVRGVPFGAPVMLRLRDFDDYEDAQLLRQKVAACHSVFITNTNGDSVLGDDKDSEEYDDIPSRVRPGMILRMAPGQEVQFANPPGAEGYESYSKNQLRAIAAGYGISYEQLTGDLSNVNFSSGRMGWIEVQKNTCTLQDTMMIPMFCAKVWAIFNEFASLKYATQYTDFIKWTPARREMLDPAKELSAMADAIRSGLMTYDEAILGLGGDPDTYLEAIAEFNKKLDEKGLKLQSDPRYFISSKVPVPPAPTGQKSSEGNSTDTKQPV